MEWSCNEAAKGALDWAWDGLYEAAGGVKVRMEGKEEDGEVCCCVVKRAGSCVIAY